VRNRKHRKLRSKVGVSNSGRIGHSFMYTAGSDNSVISGVTVTNGEILPKHDGINTNANRKHGGGGMYYKPRSSVFYGM
jgi:hypothetical protein